MHNRLKNTVLGDGTQIFFKIIVVYAVVGVLSALFTYITERSACLFINVTGVPCPACGMARSLISLFYGDVIGAFHYHPLFMAPIILLLLYIPGIERTGLCRGRKWILLAFIVAFITVWAVRLLYLFPDTEPFVFYNDSLAAYVFRIIKGILRKP